MRKFKRIVVCIVIVLFIAISLSPSVFGNNVSNSNIRENDINSNNCLTKEHLPLLIIAQLKNNDKEIDVLLRQIINTIREKESVNIIDIDNIILDYNLKIDHVYICENITGSFMYLHKLIFRQIFDTIFIDIFLRTPGDKIPYKSIYLNMLTSRLYVGSERYSYKNLLVFGFNGNLILNLGKHGSYNVVIDGLGYLIIVLNG